MENTKTIEIKDFENTLKFRIRLFDPIEGLDFLDNAIGIINSKEKLSIKPFLSTLMKLACPLDANGTNALFTNKQFSLEDAASIFQNPISLIELGFEILEFQKVFIKSSTKFHPLIQPLERKLNIKISD